MLFLGVQMLENEPEFEEIELIELDEPRKESPSILLERPKLKHGLAVALIAALCLATSCLFWFTTHHDWLAAERNAVFRDGEYWRLITSLFTHADFGHLISNLPLLVVFGWLLRAYFGLVAFPFATIILGALANWMTLYFYSPHVYLIGASGMVYGAVAIWVSLYLRYENRFTFKKKLLRAAGVLILLLFPQSYSPTTSYLAHGFGFLFGILAAVALFTLGPYDKRQQDLANPPQN
jgi:rhomboid protease GluP